MLPTSLDEHSHRAMTLCEALPTLLLGAVLIYLTISTLLGHSNTEWLHIPIVLQLKWMGRGGGFTSIHKPVLKITPKLHKKGEKITPDSIKNWIILHKVERLCSTLACVHKRCCDSPSSKAGRSLCPGDEMCRTKHPQEGFGPAWLRPDICGFLMKKERNLLLWKSKWILR